MSKTTKTIATLILLANICVLAYLWHRVEEVVDYVVPMHMDVELIKVQQERELHCRTRSLKNVNGEVEVTCVEWAQDWWKFENYNE